MDKLPLILKTGRIAPMVCDYQSPCALVIEDETAYEKFRQYTGRHFEALVVLICYDKANVWKNKANGTNDGDVDTCIVTTP